jgi:hypothetical protein
MALLVPDDLWAAVELLLPRERPKPKGGRPRASDRAALGGEAVGPNPTDRGRPGTKGHLVTDAQGTPLGLTLSGANRHDSRMLAPTQDAVSGVRTRHRGRRADALPSSTPTKPMITAAAVASAAPAASPRASHDGGREQHPPRPAPLGH